MCASEPAPAKAGDASRLAYTELLPDEKKESAIAFLDRALGWFAHLGVAVERIMTDNGSAYRSHAFRDHLAAAGLRHIRTRPYTPRTNGKSLPSRKRGPNASSRPPCANGPMPAPTNPPPSEAMPCSPGSPTTTNPDLTQPSAENLRPQS